MARREIAYFRLTGLSKDQLGEIRSHLETVPMQYKYSQEMGGYNCAIELSNPNACRIVHEALRAVTFKAQCGLWISLVTSSDSDGVNVQPHLLEFWKKVGGAIDFSFTVV